jgi:hypothetical protein
MRMKPVFLALAIASATLAMTGGAYAFGFVIGPNGVYVDPGHDYNYDNQHYDNWGIDANDAVRIAKHNGVRYVDEVVKHRHTYEVSGQTRHHNDITVTIDRGSGDVIDINRD